VRISESLCALSLLAALGLPSLANAASADGAPTPTSSEELPPLPAAPKLSLERPDEKELAELDGRLAALSSPDPAERDSAARELLEVDARLVPAIHFRLDKVADRADKEAMKRLFLELRRAAKDGDRADNEETSRGAGSPDYLTMVVSRGRPDAKAYADLVGVIGMSRMLSQIGSVEAVRTLLDVYVRFGEFLRIHTQRELARLGDKAVPALLEARRHPSEKIAHWAARQLDALGRAVPGEAVRVSDNQVLADVLRAYGRLRDPDATRIVISFANSERGVVRDAARQAIALFGEVGMWQLKDSYESVVGKKPPRDWSWERTARELFALFDRARSQEVSHTFDAGRAARAKGDLAAMVQAYDRVVAENPRFEKRAELCAGYLEYAKSVFDSQPAAAEVPLLRAERLTDDPGQRTKIQSQLLTLRAIQSLEHGVADQVLIERALELDSSNARARTLLAELRHPSAKSGTERTRQLVAGVIAMIAAGAIIALLRKRNERPLSATPSQGEAPPPLAPAGGTSEAVQAEAPDAKPKAQNGEGDAAT
jgi:hypothetical protein